LAVYATVASLTLLSCATVQLIARSEADQAIDLEACGLGLNYALGGVEYYDKVHINYIVFVTRGRHFGARESV
jgi:hypothetical protein